MADLCACQKEGIEAAADYVFGEREDLLGDEEERLINRELGICSRGIRALLTTPGQPCPRCDVVAAAERYGRAVRDTADCTCGDDGGCGPCPTCIEADEAKIALLRAIERMRS